MGPMPGISSRRYERNWPYLDLLVDCGEIGVDAVDPGQHPGERVVFIKAAGEGVRG